MKNDALVCEKKDCEQNISHLHNFRKNKNILSRTSMTYEKLSLMKNVVKRESICRELTSMIFPRIESKEKQLRTRRKQYEPVCS